MASVRLLLLVALPSLLGYGVGAGGEVVALIGDAAVPEPEFVSNQNTTVRALLGTNVTLLCCVMHLGDRTVSVQNTTVRALLGTNVTLLCRVMHLGDRTVSVQNTTVRALLGTNVTLLCRVMHLGDRTVSVQNTTVRALLGTNVTLLCRVMHLGDRTVSVQNTTVRALLGTNVTLLCRVMHLGDRTVSAQNTTVRALLGTNVTLLCRVMHLGDRTVSAQNTTVRALLGTNVTLLCRVMHLGDRTVSVQNTTVRALLGTNVTLLCRVMHLGDRTVSWVRVRDLQILTHSGVVFTADMRVSVPPTPLPRTRHAPTTHALRIDRLRYSDAGDYECQLNTEPKMSLFFELSVIDQLEAEFPSEPVTEPELWVEDGVLVWAVDGEKVRVSAGASAELACAARMLSEPDGAAPPLDIRWLREGKPVTLKDGCAVSRTSGASYAESRLRLVRVRARDAGDYTCAVGARSATVRLEVDETESYEDMEAMQRDQSEGGVDAAYKSLPTALATLALLMMQLAV